MEMIGGNAKTKLKYKNRKQREKDFENVFTVVEREQKREKRLRAIFLKGHKEPCCSQ